MPNFDNSREVFFDTTEFLSLEDSEENLAHEDLGYQIWLNEPKSVEERKTDFLRVMSSVGLDYQLGLDRLRECGGAVSSYCVSSVTGVEEHVACVERDFKDGANCTVDESDQTNSDDQTTVSESERTECSCPIEQLGRENDWVHSEQCAYICSEKKKSRTWLKHFVHKMRKGRNGDVSKFPKLSADSKTTRVKVRLNKKRLMEFSAVYNEQEISAHDGLIRTLKFSPNGQYLASGGEDAVVRVWQVVSTDTSSNLLSRRVGDETSIKKKTPGCTSVFIPDTIFRIVESPLQEFHGHTGDILDVAWSTSNSLLSASKDNTVRLWQIGSDECLGVFLHANYVTCIQFNPVDEDYFLSGSIDGKIRIWGLVRRRVVSWADVRDMVTAISYQTNGKGIAVGTITGTCRFYEASGSELLLNGEMHFCRQRRSSGNKITGIQFLQSDSQKVMITSEDSKIRLLNGMDIVHKYRAPTKSGSQMSASFTPNGRHIVSVGEDSRIYIWNYDDHHMLSSKQPKSVRSYENFFFEGTSVAIPWSGITTEKKDLGSPCSNPYLQTREAHSLIGDSGHFSFANWFLMDSSARTWPEEILPMRDIKYADHVHFLGDDNDNNVHRQTTDHNYEGLSTWGLVIVAAGWDGKIRTFHNYGLPVRV